MSLMLEIAGFLTLISDGVHVENERQQALELLDKIGAVIGTAPENLAPLNSAQEFHDRHHVGAIFTQCSDPACRAALAALTAPKEPA